MKEHHPLTQYIPELCDQSALELNIAENGLREAIVLFEDKVIEGRVRQRACVASSTEPRYREWLGEGDPFEWMLQQHIRSHDLGRTDILRLAVAALPHFRTTRGSVAVRLSKATGIGQHSIRGVIAFSDYGILEQVLSEEITWNEALSRIGFNPRGYARVPKFGTYFGKGDRFDDAITPAKRYLNAWRRRGFEYRHVNPKEAARRVRLIDELMEGLEAAREDLAKRSVRPRHTTR